MRKFESKEVKLVFQITNILQCNDKNKKLKLVYLNLGNFYKKNRNKRVKHVVHLNICDSTTIMNLVFSIKKNK